MKYRDHFKNMLLHWWLRKFWEIDCILLELIRYIFAKGLVAELAPPHTQSARREKVRAAGLVTCCN